MKLASSRDDAVRARGTKVSSRNRRRAMLLKPPVPKSSRPSDINRLILLSFTAMSIAALLFRWIQMPCEEYIEGIRHMSARSCVAALCINYAWRFETFGLVLLFLLTVESVMVNMLSRCLWLRSIANLKLPIFNQWNHFVLKFLLCSFKHRGMRAWCS